ncbi:MAG TPA: hypothetical protein VGQ78_02865 [Vicinamibacteria bacterium]|nr:hypothetical protein [Vicinamibacteria bacterium]
MRHRTLGLLLTGLLVASAAPAIAADIDFTYAFELGTGSTTSFIKGFQRGQPITLQVKLKDTGFVYIVHEVENGQYTLVHPRPEGKPSMAVTASEQLPPVKIIHVATAAEVARLVLIVSRDRISELEGLLAKGEGKMPAHMILDIRDKYYSPGLYTRDVREDSVKVDYKTTADKPAVVEEISLRPRPTVPPKPKS